MKIQEKILEELMNYLIIEVHLRKCPVCRKKYIEILKHAKEEYAKKEG